MTLHILQHVDFEGPAGLSSWAARHGHSLSITRMDLGQPLPAPSPEDCVAVMGGPMNVYEEEQYPWLKEEKRFLEGIIERDVPVVGICLGAQLLADVLGAPVFKNREREIGWHAVSVTAEGRTAPAFAGVPPVFTAFHWHGDTFNPPDGAVHLAKSDICDCQAFQYGSGVLALQFHLEATPDGVAALADHCASEVVPGRYIQPAGEFLGAKEKFAALPPLLDAVLNGFLRRK